MKPASQQFLRVGQVTPTAKIRATAEYDGAAALIALQDWPKAARVLENFRSLFPGNPLEAEVDKKLAVAYQKDNKTQQDAQTFARIARRGSATTQTREEEEWLPAMLYEGSDSRRVGKESVRTWS